MLWMSRDREQYWGGEDPQRLRISWRAESKTISSIPNISRKLR